MIEEIKRKKGNKYRATIYSADGKRSAKLFSSKTLAKEWERRALRERDEQKASGIIVNDKLTLEEFAQIWMRDKVRVRLSLSTQNNYARYLRVHILPVCGDLLLKDLRADHANRIVSNLREAGHVPKGINMILGCLLTMLNDALEWQYMSKNPLASYKQVKEPELHFDYWTAVEIQQFLNATRFHPLAPLIIVALNTGMRRGELCALKWDRVDFVQNQIIVSRSLGRYGLSETTKSGKKRYVPINPAVRKEFETLLKHQRGEFVFSNEVGGPIDAHHLCRDFHRLQKKAGFTRLIRFHDLRHTFASHFMMKGGNIYDLQKILGHSTLEMTQRYAHMSPDHLAQAIQIVSFTPDGDAEIVRLDQRRDSLVAGSKIK